jgi:undecaprenyl diphosphate synthase
VSIRIPRHVAIIMDGNGRWAQRRRHPRVFGHVRGSSRVKGIVREADRLGIKALTLYAFSTENWTRPDAELRVLWRLLKKYLVREVEELHRENVRLHVIGEIERLDADVRQVLDAALEKLSGNTGLQLTFALSYGSRRELVRAARLFAADCTAGNRKPEEMCEALMERYLWTAELGELSQVDLVIRTSGEQRVSNFLLWQAAYAEFCFTELCWPDFSPEHLREAIQQYSSRERRFGGVGAPATPASQPARAGKTAVTIV